MSAVCSNGHVSQGAEKFCTSCGAPISVANPTPAAPPPPARTALVLAIVIPLAIAALAIGLIVGTAGSSTSAAPTTTTTTTINPVIAATAAWPATSATLAEPLSITSIKTFDGVPTIFTANAVPSGSWVGPFRVAIWEFRAGQWAKVLDRELGLPLSSIEFVDLTDDGIPEAHVHGVTASGPGTAFVFGHSAQGWRLIPFGPKKYDSPGGAILFDSSPNFYSTVRNCEPSCAQGVTSKMYWKYDPSLDVFLEVK